MREPDLGPVAESEVRQLPDERFGFSADEIIDQAVTELSNPPADEASSDPTQPESLDAAPSSSNAPGPSLSTKELKKAKKKASKMKQRMKVTLLHCDLIQEDFWSKRPGLLED